MITFKYIMRKIILCLFILSATISSIAQRAHSIDSLENVLKTQQLPPSRLFGIYDTICRLSMSHDIEKLMEYAEKGLSLAKKENNKLKILTFSENKGIAYAQSASYDTALIYYNKALDLAIELEDKGQEGSIYEGMGITSWHKKEYTLSVEFFMKALSIFESTGDKERSISLYGNLSSVHHALKNYDKAIFYSEKSLESIDEEKNSHKSIIAHYNLGCIYMDKEEYDNALKYAQKALEMSRSHGSKYFEIASLTSLSNIYSYGFEDYDKALEYVQESIKARNEYGETETNYYTFCLLADIYRKQKRWIDCETNSIKAWEMDSTNIDGAISMATNIIIANIYLDKKEKAETFLWKLRELSDKYIDKDYREIILDMEAKYETEKKEMRIMALEAEQKLYIVLCIALVTVLLLAMGLLFYRHRLVIQKRKMAEQQVIQLEQEKDLIAVHSALEAEKTEREIIARDLHDGVGTMLSVVKNNMSILKSHSIIGNTDMEYFNKVSDGLDKSIIELRRVAHHIMPAILMEKGLFAALDDFCRSIPEAEFHFTEPDRRFDSEKELVLYRCAYELVNNAIRHARATRIDIHLNMDKKTVYLSVVDDGCGFDLQTTPMGMGINNIRTRLSAFDGRIEIYSEPEKGTEVNVELDI